MSRLPDYVGPYQRKNRRRLSGKHSVEKKEESGRIWIVCRKCNWNCNAAINTPFVEMAEHAAYLHVTEPDLAVAGTSDVEFAARQERLRLGDEVGYQDDPWNQA
jgi:hypothetical protein